MNELVVTRINPDMPTLPPTEEDEVSALKFLFCDRFSHFELFPGGTGQFPSATAGINVLNEATAIESDVRVGSAAAVAKTEKSAGGRKCLLGAIEAKRAACGGMIAQ